MANDKDKNTFDALEVLLAKGFKSDQIRTMETIGKVLLTQAEGESPAYASDIRRRVNKIEKHINRIFLP